MYNYVIENFILNSGEMTMSSELTLNKTNLDKILNTLRSPKNGKLFADIVEENWEKLGKRYKTSLPPILTVNARVSILIFSKVASTAIVVVPV